MGAHVEWAHAAHTYIEATSRPDWLTDSNGQGNAAPVVTVDYGGDLFVIEGSIAELRAFAIRLHRAAAGLEDESDEPAGGWARMLPSRWVSARGKVHHRRLVFWPGTASEQAADPATVVTLCGSRSGLRPAPGEAVVDCRVCLKAENTRAHLPRGSR